jgi:hypothetical protein
MSEMDNWLDERDETHTAEGDDSSEMDNWLAERDEIN